MESSAEQTQELVHHYHEKPTRFNRFKAVFKRNKSKPFDPERVQGVVLGSVLSLTLNEVCVQLMLKMSADRGELPAYVNNTVFLSISVLETLLAGPLCWAFPKRRPAAMLTWSLLAIATCLPMFFLNFDSITDAETDLCLVGPQPRNLPIMSTKAIIRLTFLIIMGLVSAFARLSIWAHGVAILDAYRPALIAKDFGIFIAARIMASVLGKDALTDFLVNKFEVQIVILIAPMIATVIMLMLLPRDLRGPDDEEVAAIEETGGQGFFTTTGRIFTNSTAMVHMVSLGVFSAAIWGFALNNDEMMKTKYQLVFAVSQAANMSDIFRTYFIILMVLITGYQYGTPVVREFQKIKAMKSAVCMTIFAAIFIMVTSLLRCDPTVNGLDATSYVQPECGLGCGCPSRASAFSPVCVLDEMTTYYSPCHAGCTNRTEVNGVSILTNCLCSASRGNATVGACAADECRGAHGLHQILFVIVLIFAVTVFTLHGLIILRSVDARDKATALGVAFSMVAFFAYVGSHLLFMGIASWTCAYKQNGRCELQNSQFSFAVGVCCATLVLISAILNITSNCLMGRKMQT